MPDGISIRYLVTRIYPANSKNARLPITSFITAILSCAASVRCCPKMFEKCLINKNCYHIIENINNTESEFCL